MRANIHVHCTVASERDYGGLRIWQVVHRLLIRLHMSWPNCDPIIEDLIKSSMVYLVCTTPGAVICWRFVQVLVQLVFEGCKSRRLFNGSR